MTIGEVRELLHGLVDQAAQRLLTSDECFLHGELLQAHEQAVRADTLGKKGRYFVIPEQALLALQKEMLGEG